MRSGNAILLLCPTTAVASGPNAPESHSAASVGAGSPMRYGGSSNARWYGSPPAAD